MYKLCKTEQSAARQRAFEEGLLQLMGTRRYEDITVSDLCEYLKIPRKSFYRYFSGKDGALHGLIDHTLMEFEVHSGQKRGSKRTLQSDLEGFFLFWKEHRNILEAAKRSGLSGALIERAISYSMSESVFPGRFLPNESKETQKHVVMFSVCGLMSMMLQWHSGGCAEPIPEMARVAGRLLTQPLFPDARKLL